MQSILRTRRCNGVFRRRSTSPRSANAGTMRLAFFQSRAEHARWIERVASSAMPRPKRAAIASAPSRAAPFLASVDAMAESRYAVWEVPKEESRVRDRHSSSSPSSSFLEVHLPLSSDLAVRTAVSDLGSWSTFRLSKFYELVDALTGDVAYRHVGPDADVAWVTAGHYHSRKIQSTDISTDVTLRSYVTKVGRSSVEIRTDGLQNDRLVNFCHTVMVALDPNTMRPVSAHGTDDGVAILPPLGSDEEDEDGQAERASLAEWHDALRRERAASMMDLRTAISSPPSPSEVRAVHDLHQRAVRMREGPQPRPPRPRTVGEYTFRSSFVVFPEDRNVHGKLFGGYVMSHSYNLALYATKCFAQSGRDDARSVVPVGIDEAVFHQPVSIGDLVTFTARVVHATECTCRVFVTVHVLDPQDADRLPQRSNRLMFVFCAETPLSCKEDGCSFVLPNTYSEVLMHVEAARRHGVEGPTDEEARSILEASSKLNPNQI